jgi:hypothetical protein
LSLQVTASGSTREARFTRATTPSVKYPSREQTRHHDQVPRNFEHRFFLESYITSEFGRRIARKRKRSSFGDGSANPRAFSAATGGAQPASRRLRQRVTADELIDLFTPQHPYRKNAVWL